MQPAPASVVHDNQGRRSASLWRFPLTPTLSRRERGELLAAQVRSGRRGRWGEQQVASSESRAWSQRNAHSSRHGPALPLTPYTHEVKESRSYPSKRRFIRLKNAPRFARGFSRHNSGVQWYLRMVGQRIHWNCLEKRSQALRGRNLTRDIQAPVRQGRVQAPDGSYHQGPFF